MISGKLKGGYAELEGVNSQWLTPLLVAGALADGDTEIREVSTMHERPYVDMTIGMMKQAGVEVENDNYETFRAKGGQTYRATDFVIPGDWGSAGYPMVAAAITGSTATFMNLNEKDYAGERAYAEILEKMGGRFEETEDTMTIYHSDLKGAFIDGHHDHRIVMATAVAALVAEGPTIISDSEYAAVSFPEFYDVMRQMGARIERLETL